MILLISLNTSSQVKMRKKTFYEIEFFEISKKERDTLFKTEGVLDDGSLSSTLVPGNTVTILGDGRVVFDVAGARLYLFSNKQDYLYFIDKTQSVAKESVTDEVLIYDDKFIENQTLYLEKLESIFQVDVLKWNAKKLTQIDDKIGRMDVKTLKEHAPVLIALIGRCLIEETKKGEWGYVNDPVNGRVPMIIIGGDLISPIKIVAGLIEKRQRKEKVSVLKLVNEYVLYYKD